MALSITEKLQSTIDAVNDAPKSLSTIAFDPSIHLAYHPPSKVHTMESIGLQNEGVSPIAMSEPFSFFTEEAVDIMRSEVLAPEVIAKHSFQSDLAPHQLRGYAAT